MVGEFTTAELPRVQLVAKMMGKDFDDLAAIKEAKEEEEHTEEDIVIKAVGEACARTGQTFTTS